MTKTADSFRLPFGVKQEEDTADTCNFKREMNTLIFLSVQTRLNKMMDNKSSSPPFSISCLTEHPMVAGDHLSLGNTPIKWHHVQKCHTYEMCKNKGISHQGFGPLVTKSKLHHVEKEDKGHLLLTSRTQEEKNLTSRH